MTTYRMTIRNAPPGLLLLRSGIVIFKTEYRDDDGNPECYVVESGESYAGDGYDVDAIPVTDDCVDAAREAWEVP